MLTRVDLETVVPLALIRSHTRTDDVVAVTDVHLELYREAAFEAAEQYTGQSWTGEQRRVQSIEVRERDRRRDGRVTISLDAPTSDGILTLSGGGRDFTITVMPGATEAVVPVRSTAIDVSSCCSGCDTPINYGWTVTYKTGACSKDDIPAGIRMGVLKYIAWAIENPGDVLNTVARAGRMENGMLSGTNNGAWGSGAIEQWRQYRLRVAA